MLVQIADIEGVEETRRPVYQEGLRNVIIGLKEKKVQGFEEVAKAILKYRKEFAREAEKEKVEVEKMKKKKEQTRDGKGCSQEEEEEDMVMEDV